MENPEISTNNANEVNNQLTQRSENVTLEGDKLREAILTQVEFYFSRENLASDHYLVSNMDNDYYVSLSTIANFGKVKSLTTDIELLVDVLSSSQLVKLDDTKTKIKPANINQRSTLILRDLGEATEEDVKKLFEIDELPTPLEIKNEIGTTWFVTFNSKEITLRAIALLKEKTFNDKPLRAGIKTENILKSCNLFRTPDIMKVNTNPQYWNSKGAWMNQGRPYWDPSLPQSEGDQKDNSNRNGNRYRKRKDYNSSRKPHYNNNNNTNNNNNNNNNNNSGRGRKKGRDGKKQTPSFQLATAQFPPLPSSKKDRKGGYTTDFVKYSQEELIKIVQSLGVVPKPQGVPEDAIVVIDKANTDLETLKPLPVFPESEEGTQPIPLSEVIKSKSNNSKKESKSQKPRSNQKSSKSDHAKSESKSHGSSDHHPRSSGKPTWSQIVTVPKNPNNSSSNNANNNNNENNINNDNSNIISHTNSPQSSAQIVEDQSQSQSVKVEEIQSL